MNNDKTALKVGDLVSYIGFPQYKWLVTEVAVRRKVKEVQIVRPHEEQGSNSLFSVRKEYVPAACLVPWVEPVEPAPSPTRANILTPRPRVQPKLSANGAPRKLQLRFYLAGSSQHAGECQQRMKELEDVGAVNVLDWTKLLNSEVSHDDQLSSARRDAAAVVAADIVIVYALPPTPSLGASFELGYAVKGGKETWWVGPPQGIFYSLARYRFDEGSTDRTWSTVVSAVTACVQDPEKLLNLR